MPFLLVLLSLAQVVEDADFGPLREQCQRLVKELDKRQVPLPAATVKELGMLFEKGASDPTAAGKIQKLLDVHCLCLVDINPESRVKAARGPLGAALVKDRPTLVLVKVHNQAGVTHPLKISGSQLGKGKGRWLEATVLLPEKLSGQKVDYALVRLVPREAGKREATLGFDVGQGTQDLGFRAEVPILFTVRP